MVIVYRYADHEPASRPQGPVEVSQSHDACRVLIALPQELERGVCENYCTVSSLCGALACCYWQSTELCSVPAVPLRSVGALLGLTSGLRCDLAFLADKDKILASAFEPSTE
jgi:hypothetical protein